MTPAQPEPLPPVYILGDKQEHGTYNANILFCNGEPVAQMSGLPINTTAEEMEAAKGMLKHWKPAWERAKAIRDILNSHATQADEARRLRDLLKDALAVIDTHIPLEQPVCRPGISRRIRAALGG